MNCLITRPYVTLGTTLENKFWKCVNLRGGAGAENSTFFITSYVTGTVGATGAKMKKKNHFEQIPTYGRTDNKMEG